MQCTETIMSVELFVDQDSSLAALSRELSLSHWRSKVEEYNHLNMEHLYLAREALKKAEDAQRVIQCLHRSNAADADTDIAQAAVPDICFPCHKRTVKVLPCTATSSVTDTVGSGISQTSKMLEDDFEVRGCNVCSVRRSCCFEKHQPNWILECMELV